MGKHIGKVGSTWGSNALKRKIDGNKGGNSEVWSAESAGQKTAVKILRRTEPERRRRFLNEIEFHSRFTDDGVLPLLESDPDTEHPWFSMPIAVNVSDALAEDRSAQRVVDIVASYAEILTRLAGQGVSHRDIKPDNLFLLDGRPVIGDFGIVDFPGKEEITAAGDVMGPLHYHAPEALTDPLGSDGEPADVWTLAKTLWVLLTGQTYPLPGEYRPGSPYDLAEWISHPRTIELNDLIVHCTRFAPRDRPSMASVAESLRASAVPPAEVRNDATIPELQQRLLELTQPSVDRFAEAEVLRQRLADADVLLSSHVGAVGLFLVGLLAGRFQEHPSPADYAGTILTYSQRDRIEHRLARSVLYHVPYDNRVKVVHSATADLLDPAGRMRLCGYFAVIEHFGHRDHPLVEWTETFSVSMDSPEFEKALAYIQAEVENRQSASLKAINEILHRSVDDAPGWFQDQRAPAQQ